MTDRADGRGGPEVGEQPLDGGMGSGGGVVRRGDVVLRPVRPHTEAVAGFLRHLEAVGFEGAPRHLGFDGRGGERRRARR